MLSRNSRRNCKQGPRCVSTLSHPFDFDHPLKISDAGAVINTLRTCLTDANQFLRVAAVTLIPVILPLIIVER